MEMKKILFVCKHNRFRSKIAEAYFKKINKSKMITASSAGIFKGEPVAKNVVSLGKEKGFKISRKTRGLSEELTKKIDVVVIVANDVPAELFKGKVKKVIKWNIPDSNQNEKRKIEFVAEKIMRNVDKLNKKLK
jgi:protein-tyrosine-phosphatase